MEYLICKFTFTGNEALFNVAQDILAQALAEIGFDAFENDGNMLSAYIQRQFFNEERIVSTIKEFPIDDIHISFVTELMEDKNWNETWENEGFDPIAINQQLIVYDAKHKVPDATLLSSYKISIGIDACQAFGTGTHQTTQLMLGLMSELQMDNLNVVDAGCGSGILSIAASMMGAKSIVAFDIDEWSVRNTLHNAMLNGVSNIEAIHSDGDCLNDYTAKFDVALANINRNILMQMMPLLAGCLKEDGHLFVSGFYLEDAPMLRDAAKEYGLKLLKQQSKNDWCAIHFRR